MSYTDSYSLTEANIGPKRYLLTIDSIIFTNNGRTNFIKQVKEVDIDIYNISSMTNIDFDFDDKLSTYHYKKCIQKEDIYQILLKTENGLESSIIYTTKEYRDRLRALTLIPFNIKLNTNTGEVLKDWE